MINRLLIILSIMLSSCGDRPQSTEEHEEHTVSFAYTTYNDHYELFIDSEMALPGQTVALLCHFTRLNDFKPLDSAMVILQHELNGNVAADTSLKPLRKGVYEFTVKPDKAGNYKLSFIVNDGKNSSQINVNDFNVFDSEEEAEATAEILTNGLSYAVPFAKEFSWKIDFATGFPSTLPFGGIIKTTALVQPSQEGQIVVTAKTNGIAIITQSDLIAGAPVKKDELLLSITGSDLAENNITLRAGEIKNNYEKARNDYERAEVLAKDRIVSEKELLDARTEYENAKAALDNLHQFGASGMRIASPMSGYIQEVLIKNGSYVTAGQPVVIISRNMDLNLTAEVPLKFAPALGTIQTANIRMPGDTRTYSLEELDGRILSYGKSAGIESYLIPVILRIYNRPGYTPGSIAEVYLKTGDGKHLLTVPNSSLIEEQGSFSIWVQITPELFEKREVTVGETDGLRTAILKGLSEQERIVTQGGLFIKLSQATGTLDAHAGHVH